MHSIKLFALSALNSCVWSRYKEVFSKKFNVVITYRILINLIMVCITTCSLNPSSNYSIKKLQREIFE